MQSGRNDLRSFSKQMSILDVSWVFLSKWLLPESTWINSNSFPSNDFIKCWSFAVIWVKNTNLYARLDCLVVGCLFCLSISRSCSSCISFDGLIGCCLLLLSTTLCLLFTRFNSNVFTPRFTPSDSWSPPGKTFFATKFHRSEVWSKDALLTFHLLLQQSQVNDNKQFQSFRSVKTNLFHFKNRWKDWNKMISDEK